MALAQLTKKGGRYTKKERNERRAKVFQLHFEYGNSARKISQLMSINRDTINRDVSFWYSELRIEDDKVRIEDWINKQLSRLESQRGRIRKELDSDITLQEKLQVEKMILELDSKISNMIFKIRTSKHSLIKYAVDYINHWMEEKGHPDRYMARDSLYTIPEKSRKKIFKLLDI